MLQVLIGNTKIAQGAVHFRLGAGTLVKYSFRPIICRLGCLTRSLGRVAGGDIIGVIQSAEQSAFFYLHSIRHGQFLNFARNFKSQFHRMGGRYLTGIAQRGAGTTYNDRHQFNRAYNILFGRCFIATGDEHEGR